MPAKKPKPKIQAEDLRKPSSISRPQTLAKRFDEFLIDASSELKRPINHSQAVCALEELAMENTRVNDYFMRKLADGRSA